MDQPVDKLFSCHWEMDEPGKHSYDNKGQEDECIEKVKIMR